MRNHQLESRMREIRLSGSEGGGAELNRLSLPLSKASALLNVRARRPHQCAGEDARAEGWESPPGQRPGP